jgi:TonB family protein
MSKSRLLSISAHLVIVALILMLRSVTHQVVVARPRYTDQLVFAVPAQLPPQLKLTRYAAVSTNLPAATRLAFSVPSTLHTARVDEQPRMVSLSVPEALELPSPTLRVSEAPQAVVGTFQSTAGVMSSHQAASVSAAGFGTSTAQATQRNGEARVVMAGFSVAVASAPRAATTSTPKPLTLPAIVKYIPRAHYTQEARAAGISGEVTLTVCLKADGTVQVLGVLRGLGFGLDEIARQVAAGVKFEPATRDGKPVDSTHVLTVQFELS